MWLTKGSGNSGGIATELQPAMPDLFFAMTTMGGGLSCPKISLQVKQLPRIQIKAV